MQEFIQSFRTWNSDWLKYDIGKLDKKPCNIDKLLEPFLAKEKQSIIGGYNEGYKDCNNLFEQDAEKYFNKKYGK